MFVRPMGKKSPPNVKVGLTGDEARVLSTDLAIVVALAADMIAEFGDTGTDAEAVERVTALLNLIEEHVK